MHLSNINVTFQYLDNMDLYLSECFILEIFSTFILIFVLKQPSNMIKDIEELYMLIYLPVHCLLHNEKMACIILVKTKLKSFKLSK